MVGQPRSASQVRTPLRQVWASLATGLVLVSACHPRDGRVEVTQRPLVATGFEKPAELPAAAQGTATAEKSHTGKFSVRADSLHKTVTLYQGEIGRLCTHQPRRFIVSAWVWVPSFEDDAALSFSLTQPNESNSFFQQKLYLSDTGSFGKWKFVSHSIDLPNSIRPQSQLAVTLAGPDSNKPVYVDDLTIAELW